MKEEMETIKLRSGNQLARENYLLLNKSKAQILNILLNTEEKMEDLQSQLKAKEEVIKEAREYIKKHIRIDDEYPAYMEMLITERDELDEILSKGENDEILK